MAAIQRARISDAMDSPWEPLFFYPLSEPTFARLSADWISYLERDIPRLSSEIQSQSARALDKIEKTGFFQLTRRELLMDKFRVEALASCKGSMGQWAGEFVNMYGVRYRPKLLQSDKMFPFQTPSTYTVSYQLVRGLRTHITPPFREVSK